MADLEIVVRRDGAEVDITEGVQILYDIVIASMDWGSGFLDEDEVLKVAALAGACGFKGEDEIVESYFGNLFGRNADGVYGYTHKDKVGGLTKKAKDIRAMFKSVPVVRP